MATKKETRSALAKERRVQLKALSQKLKSDNALLLLTDTTIKVNDLLIKWYEKNFEVKDLKTYEQWKNLGFQVRRGEESYMVWGTPRTIKVGPKPENEEEQEEKDDFFPVCHLFDASQVAPIRTKSNN